MARVSFHATGGAASWGELPHVLSTERAWLTASRNSTRIDSIPGISVPGAGIYGGGDSGGDVEDAVPESPPPHPQKAARTMLHRMAEPHLTPVIFRRTGSLPRTVVTVCFGRNICGLE